MSHYTVLVAIDPNDPKRPDLETALAPFDENLEVEPYRDYEEGEPLEYWVYRALKRAAQHVADGTGILPYEPDALGASNRSSKKTPAEQQAELEADAATFHALPDPVTWADIVTLHNERYGDDESDSLHLSEDGRAYTVSTYSKNSKWDWYQIGGRWTGYFYSRPEYTGHPDLIAGQPGTMTEPNFNRAKCDGGPKYMLDLPATRKMAEAEELGRHVEFCKLVEGLPEATLWSVFVERHKADEDGYPIEQARADYHAQPRVLALKGTDFQYWNDPFEHFQRPREEVLARAAAQAVPGYATLTLEGEWKEPGRMGWFGMSTDTPESQDAYYAWANEYVESLGDDIVLVLVDVHI